MLAVNYERDGSLKSLIRNLIWLERMAERGDTVAASVAIDLKNALGSYGGGLLEILTAKQRKVIDLVLMQDYTQKEVADHMAISQQGVSYLLSGGIKRIQKFLSTGKIPWRRVTEDERAYILENYGKVPIEEIAACVQRSESNCRVIYHNLMKGGDGNEQAVPKVSK